MTAGQLCSGCGWPLGTMAHLLSGHHRLPETLSPMPNAPKTPVSTFRIPLDLKARAADAAAANGTSLTAIVVAALEQYVKKNGSKR